MSDIDLLTQVDYLVDACESDPANAAERSSPDKLYELVVGLADALRTGREIDAPLNDELARANSEIRLLTQELRETREALDEERRARVDLVAKLSEARIAVPEPLALGQVIKIDRHVLGGFDHVTVSSRKPLVSLADGDEVGIWPANLAEQVCDVELDREGLELEVAALAGVVRYWHDVLAENHDLTPMTEWTARDWAATRWTPTEANAILRALKALDDSDG